MNNSAVPGNGMAPKDDESCVVVQNEYGFIFWQTAVGMVAESPQAAPLLHFTGHKPKAAAEDLQRTARHPQK